VAAHTHSDDKTKLMPANLKEVGSLDAGQQCGNRITADNRITAEPTTASQRL